MVAEWRLGGGTAAGGGHGGWGGHGGHRQEGLRMFYPGPQQPQHKQRVNGSTSAADVLLSSSWEGLCVGV
ncbi:hypothetical protein CgunFtcFv8_013760 [Champsocephalus gunnari]|uniref:Uncharacterized protein n=1 Tax=Champsocephalus gunnari TaxID=52237 RepID=A0AAN8E1A3_CHAGU|nr:hypothetical protein CgunFtcFv8_013760 [Champsocephalus gunnari]